MPPRRQFNFERIFDLAQQWFFIPLVVLIFILLLAWSIDSVRLWMQSHGARGLDVPAIVAIALAAILFVLISFQHELKQMGERLSVFAPATSKIIRGGIRDVYTELDKIVAELGTGSGRGRSLDVLGLTLFTAWPMALEPNLNSSEGGLRGWRVNVFFVSPEFAKANSYFSPTWALQSEAQRSAVREFAANKSQMLRDHGTELTVTQYKFFPAVHGFRTGAGHLLISYTHWSGELLEGPTQFYEYFQPSDKSVRASHYRALFDNWIERAGKDVTVGKVI